jgi:hypothetical protein
MTCARNEDLSLIPNTNLKLGPGKFYAGQALSLAGKVVARS